MILKTKLNFINYLNQKQEKILKIQMDTQLQMRTIKRKKKKMKKRNLNVHLRQKL